MADKPIGGLTPPMSTFLALMTDLWSKLCMKGGIKMTKEHSGSSASATTNTHSEKEKPRCYPLRISNDGVVYPALDLAVYVVGPPADTRGFSKWLGRAGCFNANELSMADLVVFTGGHDVNPKLYGQAAMAGTHFDDERDSADMAVYRECIDRRIPMLGICRGAQLLWVTQGGTLYQDVDNHNEGEHEIVYYPDNKRYLASSVHHQACYPGGAKEVRLLATCAESRTRSTPNYESLGSSIDFEMYAFEKKGIVGIQGHPEYEGWPEYSALCIRVIKEFIRDSRYTQFEGGLLRVVEKNPIVN